MTIGGFLHGKIPYSFGFPEPGFGSECFESPLISLVDRPPRSCTRTYSSAAALCSGASKANIANAFGFSIGRGNVTTTPVTVTAGNYFQIYAENSSYVNLTAASFPPTYTVVSPSVCRCSNVLLQVDYLFGMQQNNQIAVETAKADLYFINYMDFPCTGSVKLQQKYSASFFINKTDLVHSGNPGYTMGAPLLVGQLVQNAARTNSSIQMDYPFYRMKGILSNGSCLFSSRTGNLTWFASNQESQAIEFGYDAIYSCGLRLSLQGMQDFCTAASLRNMLFLQDVLQNMNYFGIFGNADPTVLNVPHSSRQRFDSFPTRIGFLPRKLLLQSIVWLGTLIQVETSSFDNFFNFCCCPL